MRGSRWADIWQVFRAAVISTADVSKDMVATYVSFLKKLGTVSLALAFGLLPLPILGSILHMSWLNGLYLVLLTVLTFIWLMAVSPVLVLTQYAFEHFKGFRKMAQILTGLLFWTLLLSVYFYLVPVWNNPVAIPLCLILCAVLAIGAVKYGIGMNPRLGVAAVLVTLIVVTIGFYMPSSRAAAKAFGGWLDNAVARRLTAALEPAPKTPQRLRCDFSSVEKTMFFDPGTGEPKVWYYAGQDGKIELFDGPGYHPHYKQALQPIAPDVVARLKKQLQEEFQRSAEQERKRNEEAARLAQVRAREATSDRKAAQSVKTPITTKRPVMLLPEETKGEVQRPVRRDLVKGNEEFLKPEEIVGDVNRPKD